MSAVNPDDVAELRRQLTKMLEQMELVQDDRDTHARQLRILREDLDVVRGQRDAEKKRIQRLIEALKNGQATLSDIREERDGLRESLIIAEDRNAQLSCALDELRGHCEQRIDGEFLHALVIGNAPLAMGLDEARRMATAVVDELARSGVAKVFRDGYSRPRRADSGAHTPNSHESALFDEAATNQDCGASEASCESAVNNPQSPDVEYAVFTGPPRPVPSRSEARRFVAAHRDAMATYRTVRIGEWLLLPLT